MSGTDLLPKGGELLNVFQGETLMRINLTHPEVVLQGFLDRRLLLFGTLKKVLLCMPS